MAAAPPAGGTRVDIEDIDQRILALPVATKNYVALLAGKAGSVYLVEAPEFMWVGSTSRTTPAPRIVLHKFDLKARKADMPLYTLRNKKTGEIVLTQDPGQARGPAAAGAGVPDRARVRPLPADPRGRA